jgi:poly-gamma-glutamate biosynthesis protein PgsC/CapC
MTATLIVGLAAALLYIEITGLVPGGIIVPAYLALYFDQPGRLAATIAAALLAFGSCQIASRFFLIFGRRRFVFLLLAGAFFGQAWLLFWPHLEIGRIDLRVIGWVIPGLLANNLVRQKFWPTLAGVATVTALTVGIVELLRLAGR